jgi:hypothetical protein
MLVSVISRFQLLSDAHWELIADLLPKAFGPWQTVWTWHRRMAGDGTWDHVLSLLHAQAEREGFIDWEGVGGLDHRPRPPTRYEHPPDTGGWNGAAWPQATTNSLSSTALPPSSTPSSPGHELCQTRPSRSKPPAEALPAPGWN